MEQRLLAPTKEYLARPSKGIRARLVAEGFELGRQLGSAADPGREACLAQLSAVIEMIHAGSLILDDIQDRSDMRRGRPAFHVEHGEPAAITVGSWLLAWSQQVVWALPVPNDTRQQLSELILNTIAEAHYGQILDVTTQVHSLALKDIAPIAEYIARSKTGRLTACALAAGAILAGCDKSQSAAIMQLGEAMGVLLQRLDDLANCLTDRSGPKRYEDLINGRVTWVWAYLAIYEMNERAAMHAAIAALPQDSTPFLRLAADIELKEQGESVARAEFDAALAQFEQSGYASLTAAMRPIAAHLVRAFLG